MILRKSFLLLCCFCLIGAAHGQNFTVLHVSPNVKLASTNQPVALGQELKPDDQIDLGGRAGLVVMWGGPLNIKSLRPVELPGNKWKTSGKVSELVSPVVSQPKKEFRERFTGMTELIAHFAGRRYLLLDKSWLIAEPSFRLKGDTVLFYKFESPRANVQVSRKVEHRNDSLLLDPKFILDMNGKPVPPDDATNFELYLLDLKTKGYKKLAHFNFIFVDDKILVEEVGRLVKLVQAADKEADVRKEVSRFLIEAYGVPDPHNFSKWMGQHFPDVK